MVGDRQPAISADFDVYLSDNTLVYIKEPCARADTEAQFFLALYPVDVADLPGPRQQYGFDSLDFNFDRQGNRFRDFCWAVVPLPDYAIATISTGQYVPVEGGFEHLWEGSFSGKKASEHFHPAKATALYNRRSGESRNPGNPRGKSGPAAERPGFRLSPERRWLGLPTVVRVAIVKTQLPGN